jgi:hypothetical protein
MLGIVGAFLGILFLSWRGLSVPPGACGLYVIGPMFEGSIIGGSAGFMLGLLLVWRYESHCDLSRRNRDSANQ